MKDCGCLEWFKCTEEEYCLARRWPRRCSSDSRSHVRGTLSCKSDVVFGLQELCHSNESLGLLFQKDRFEHLGRHEIF